MKKVLSVVAVLSIISVAVVFAANYTLTYTAAQDTSIQQNLIPMYNRVHCAKFGQVPNCTSANLVSGGCIPVVFQTVTIDSCTIFTSDAAGEQAFLQEIANQRLLDVFNQLIADEAIHACTNFKALSAANRNTICGLLGPPVRSTGCSICAN